MSKPFLWLGPARLPFLVLTPACVLLGLLPAMARNVLINLLTPVLMAIGIVMS